MPDYKKELEEFAYIVSHDFNAPMRHIKQFSQLLVKKLGDKVGEDEKEYLHYLENAVQKSEAMLEALLNYSRLNTTAQEFSTFDCNLLIADVLSGFDTDNVKITIEELPSDLVGEQKQIKQLFLEILDNSFKFRNPDVPLEIKISAEQKNDQWQFLIQDNGIGIGPEYIDTMFTMFKRVHINDEYPGIGAGLTIAKKIVQHHDGEIWIESNQDNTTVFFTLSKPKS